MKYKHFNCVAALTNKLQETLEFTDSQLERILAQVNLLFSLDLMLKSSFKDLLLFQWRALQKTANGVQFAGQISNFNDRQLARALYHRDLQHCF